MDKNSKIVKIGILWLIGTLLSVPAIAQQSQTKPLWIQKGEKSLNKQRSNDKYYFKAFNTYGTDANKLKAERFLPLLTHVRERYGADFKQMKLDSLRLGSDTLMTYRVTFTDTLGATGVAYAQSVDKHMAFEDYVNNTYQFEFYQLYAISKKDSVPMFDDFELTQTSNKKAMLLSLIPGMGQLYKGHKTKGYVILGTEAALVTSAIVFQIKAHHYGRKAPKEPEVGDSWRSKSRGWRQMRDLAIGLAGGVYVYNLIDAAITTGSRQVAVKKAKEKQLFVTPTASPESAGITLTLSF